MENADETLYSKVRTQLVRNTVNTDSSEVDRLYPESIDKTTESANSGLRERVSGLSRYHSRVERSELRSEGKLSCIGGSQVASAKWSVRSENL